jgi:hypothetical protein
VYPAAGKKMEAIIYVTTKRSLVVTNYCPEKVKTPQQPTAKTTDATG